jgi:two-component system, NarL family, sensor kinase
MFKLLLKWMRRYGMPLSVMIIIGLSGIQVQTKADNVADSLLILLTKAKEDTNKVKLLLRVCDAYLSSEKDQSLKYSKSSLALSRKLNFDHGKMLSNEKLGIIYRDIAEFDSALFHIDQAIKFAELTNDKTHLVKNYNLYGSLLRRKGYYSSALEYHKKGLALSRQINDTLGTANSCIFIAIVHDLNSNYDSAINYYYISMRIYEKLENKQLIGVTLLNVGDLYESMNEYSNAIEKYKKGLVLFNELEDIKNMGLSNNKIGVIYEQVGNYDSALYHYRISQGYFNRIDNVSGLAHLNIDLGNLFLDWKLYDSAFYYLNIAKNSFYKMGFQSGYFNALMGLAIANEKKGQIKMAMDIYDTCENIASQLDQQSLLKVYDRKTEIYKNAKNYVKAFQYQSNYYDIKDTIFKLEKVKTVADVELKYEKEKDQAKILVYQNESLKKDVALEKKTRQRNAYIFSGSGIILVLIFIFAYYHQRTRKNRTIIEQKIFQLEEEKKLLAARSIVNGQEEERKRIAKELHDGLGVLLSTAKMQFSSIKDKSPENKPLIEKATKLLEQATGDVRRISHNMMPGLLTKFGLYEAVEDLFENVNEMEGISAEVKIEGEKARLPENKEIMLYRIIQEMVNNTLKHAQASKVVLKMEIQPKLLKMIYSDNGKGFDLENMLELKTIGLTSIQSRVKFLEGDVIVTTQPGEGVKYEMEIPTNLVVSG